MKSKTLLYVKEHWQLYVVFLLPALVLTLVFRYIPMGGILIAFQDYNPIKGLLDSRWVGIKHFARFLSSPDFLSYLEGTAFRAPAPDDLCRVMERLGFIDPGVRP